MEFQYPNEFDFMHGIDAFPAYIYKTKFNFNFESFKDKVDKYLSDSKKLSTENNYVDPEEGDAITGVHFNYDKNIWDVPHNWKEFETFFEFIETVSPFLVKTWFQHTGNFKMHVTESWINVHNKGGWTTPHHHQNSTISIAAYLNVPEGSGDLMVENPLKPYKCSEPLPMGYDHWGKIEVETNDVLFFPGWLTHKTEKNNTNNPRYVLSTNMMLMPPNYPCIPRWGYEGRNLLN